MSTAIEQQKAIMIDQKNTSNKRFNIMHSEACKKFFD